jgi:eukaryotic-like serine/threonine-protein kinase
MTQVAESLPRLAKYEVLEEIGHGGMATVYRARDKRLGREVAVKIIHRHLRESAEVGRRFTAEARAVAKLRHPGIVEIYDVSDDDTTDRHLVAELVDGESLRKTLLDAKVLPAEVTAAIGVELAAALAHAHERGVVHRDVKPENVLFGFPRSEGDPDVPARVVVKLTDFGIAKMLDQQGVTATGQVLGSPAYMAPEQIECGDVDARSDVFALGVLLYECMVGHLPFDGKNPAQVLRRVLDGQFPAADMERPTIGASLSAIVARALAHAPEDRFPGMLALAEALAEELRALGIEDHHGEIDRYFHAPEAYQAALPTRLVPKLIERGKAAHARGDVVSAAAHFNRALALAPADATILALVNDLSRGEARKTLLRQGAMALALAMTVGVGTWGMMRATKKPPVARSWSSSEVIARALVPVSIVPDPSATAAPRPTGSGSVRPPSHPVAHVGPGPQHVEPAKPLETRLVIFNVSPKSAKVSIDGFTFEAFNLQRPLTVGRHDIAASVAESNPCCNPSGVRSYDVPPDPEGKPFNINIILEKRPATVISMGPASAVVRCHRAKIQGSAEGSYVVPMADLELRGVSCSLYDGGREVATDEISLKAGQSITLPWKSIQAP